MNNTKELPKKKLISEVIRKSKTDIIKNSLPQKAQELIKVLKPFDTDNNTQCNDAIIRQILDITTYKIPIIEDSKVKKELEEFSRLCSMYFTRAY
ncbi:MAG: hypothetical protein ACLFPL_00315 [Candidatus Nanoarchaeia archaeon]